MVTSMLGLKEKVVIGNVEIVSISDGEGAFETSAFFPSVPAQAWEPYRRYLGSDGKIHPNFGCFVIRSQGRTLMVDTGIGKGFPGRLANEFGRLSISPDEVSAVIFTHLHPDHVGWNLTRVRGQWRPFFARARYYISKPEWEFFTKPETLQQTPYIKETVLPLQELGVLEIMDPETEFTSEVSTVFTPGHTPGHVSVLISSRGSKGLILGDVAHTPVQTLETNWSPGFDVDPDLSRQTRHKIFDMLEKGDFVAVGAGHFPRPSFGRIIRVEGRRYWQPL